MMQHNSEIDVRAAGPDLDQVLMHLEFLAKPNAGLDLEYKFEIRAIREGNPPRSLLINPTNDEGLEEALAFVNQATGNFLTSMLRLIPRVYQGRT